MRHLLSVLALALGLTWADAATAGSPEGDARFDQVIYDRVEAHVSQHVGPVTHVWHEVVSPRLHIDLLPVAPTEDRPFWVIVTAGMSYQPMTLPEGLDAKDWGRAELMILVPADWAGNLADPETIKDEGNFAPFRLLKEMARFPHNNTTFLGPGHTVQNGKPVAPGSPMDSAMIHWSVALPSDQLRLTLDNGDKINFYAVYPIHASERQVAVDQNTDVVFEKMLETGAGLVFNPKRPPLFPAN